ncbi:MAG TPA: permease prefix domain 1-containing protein, partial [Chthoniobacterales bacterium]|nr:permease prefix domain 1-containing protein [Chthoniobacterales bacterium]
MTTLLSRTASLLRNVTRKRHMDRDLTEEISAYMAMSVEDKMKQGITEEEARRAAAMELGGVEQVKEEVRAGRAGSGLESFIMDVRYGMRSLLKKPGFTITAVVALALGIGANTAIFSVINGVLLRSLSYANPEKIVMVWEHKGRSDNRKNVISPANFLDWKSQSKTLEHLAAVVGRPAILTGVREPEEIKIQFVSRDF